MYGYKYVFNLVKRAHFSTAFDGNKNKTQQTECHTMTFDEATCFLLGRCLHLRCLARNKNVIKSFNIS